MVYYTTIFKNTIKSNNLLKMKRLIYVLIVPIIMCSCKNSTHNKIDTKEQIEIFQNKYISTPDTSFQIGDNKLLFVSHKNNQEGPETDINNIIIIEKLGDGWGEITNTTISKGYRNILSSFEIVNIDNKTYLYFEDFQDGGSSGNFDLEFSLYDILSNIKYYIHYSEIPRGSITETDYKKSRNLVEFENLKIFLDKKVKNSKRTHISTSQENSVKQFLIANEKAILETQKQYSLKKAVKFRLVPTKENIFDIPVSNSLLHIENEHYIIISLFKGPVLGFNKSTKDYFCVWAPGSMYDWIEQMKFFEDTDLLVLYDRTDNNPIYGIDLNEFEYMRVK